MSPVARVPADCRVLDCTDLMIDESSLTGETMPAEKTSSILLFEETHDIPIAERTNITYMVSWSAICSRRHRWSCSLRLGVVPCAVGTPGAAGEGFKVGDPRRYHVRRVRRV